MGRKLSNLILILAVAVFLISGVQLARIYLEYRKGTSEYEKLVQAVEMETLPPVVPQQIREQLESGETEAEEETGESQETEAALSLETLNHEQLKAINSDYIGWLAMNDTINYPVVQGSDDTFYLTHTFQGTRNKAGTLFMGAEISEGWAAKNPIIYGHNLKNSKMFATLMEYENQAYYEKNRYFTVYTEAGDFTYEIFAAFRTGEVSEAYQYGFADEASFTAYIQLMQSWSTIQTGVTVNPEDKIITLSTCTNVDNGRFVVQGRLISQTAENAE